MRSATPASYSSMTLGISRSNRSARQSVVDDALGPDDSASELGHGSTTSRHSNSSSTGVRRLEVAAQRAAIEAEAALSEERRNLELE